MTDDATSPDPSTPGSPGSATNGGAGDRPRAATADASHGVDLGAVVVGLLGSPEWEGEDRASIAVLHAPTLRLVVTALRAGAELHNDDPDEVVVVQLLRGSGEVSAGLGSIQLTDRSLVSIRAGTPWTVRATTDAAVLLTVVRGASR